MVVITGIMSITLIFNKILLQQWVTIRVEYITSTLNSIRRYMIIEDGLEYLVLEGPFGEDPITGF